MRADLDHILRLDVLLDELPVAAVLLERGHELIVLLRGPALAVLCDDVRLARLFRRRLAGGSRGRHRNGMGLGGGEVGMRVRTGEVCSVRGMSDVRGMGSVHGVRSVCSMGGVRSMCGMRSVRGVDRGVGRRRVVRGALSMRVCRVVSARGSLWGLHVR